MCIARFRNSGFGFRLIFDSYDFRTILGKVKLESLRKFTREISERMQKTGFESIKLLFLGYFRIVPSGATKAQRKWKASLPKSFCSLLSNFQFLIAFRTLSRSNG